MFKEILTAFAMMYFPLLLVMSKCTKQSVFTKTKCLLEMSLTSFWDPRNLTFSIYF